jgi:hypothetical protein
MMLRVAGSIFMTAPQQGQVTSKLESCKWESRFATGDDTAYGNLSPNGVRRE